MWIADQWQDYELLDCGGGEKLERWDKQYLVRPDPQAIWETPRRLPEWKRANARYLRSQTGGGHWEKKALPESWQVHYKDLTFQVKPMNFKHTGLFPEQAVNWDFVMDKIRKADRPIRVLNLFAYTGGATVACAKAGAAVCHVDAAKGMVAWAKDNALEAGGEPVPLCEALRRGSVGQAVVRAHQLLHHRSGPQCAGVSAAPAGGGEVRRHRQLGRAGSAGDGYRHGAALRRHRTMVF